MTPEAVEAMVLAGQKAWRECPLQPVDGVRRGAAKWDLVRYWLLRDDPEVLEYMRELLDEERCASVRAKLRGEKRTDASERRYQSQGVDLEDVARRGPAAIARAASGKMVWLYHGTSSKLLPSIRKRGLRIGDAKVDSTETPGVYLTALPGGGFDPSGAFFYARRAVAAFGGEPVVLRVLVPFDSLARDMDDDDIVSGNWQFVTDYVEPSAIKEINGERVKASRKKNPTENPAPPARRANHLGAPKADPWVFRRRFTYALTRRPATTWTVPKGFVEIGAPTDAHPHGTVTFARPLKRDALESFELEPLDPDDPVILKRAFETYRDEVYRHFVATGGFEQPDGEGGRATLTRSTRAGVDYQVTFWLPDWTPTGHLDVVDDFDEAARTLWSNMPKDDRARRRAAAVWRAG